MKRILHVLCSMGRNSTDGNGNETAFNHNSNYSQVITWKLASYVSQTSRERCNGL